MSFFTSAYLMFAIILNMHEPKEKYSVVIEVYFSGSLPNLGSGYLPAVGSTFIIKFDVCVHFDYLV